MTKPFLSKEILLPLSWIRAAALVLQLIYLFWLGQSLIAAIWVILVLQLVLLLNQFFYRKESSQNLLMVNLAIDAILLAAYVYFTGGSSNPLISLLLLPVITASVLLSFKTSLMVLVVTNVSYALIWWQSQNQHQHHLDQGFNQHVIGMWLVFIATSCLIFFVVSYLSRANQQQQSWITRQKQRQIRDEHIMALGLSAADAAHQINTPLSTLSVLLEEVVATQNADELNASTQVMQQQIARCHEITKNMSAQYKQLSSNELVKTSVADFIDLLTNKYRLLHPQTRLLVESGYTAKWQDAFVWSHLGLHSAFLNILDNAAKASQVKQKDFINLYLSKDKFTDSLVIKVIDYGEGIDDSFYQYYGLIPAETSASGMGVGSLVSSASIERVGGSLAIDNHPEGGALVTITLPLIK